MSDGKIVIETALDTKAFQNGINQLGTVASKGIGVATKAIAGVGTGLAGIGAFAVNAGMSFESAFAGVKKTVNASDKELAGFRKGIREMSKEMPTSANEIAGVAEAAGQLGIKNKSLLSFTKTMTMLGDSTNMSAEEAATSLARLANITGMPQKNFDRLGATIVDLGNNLATTESEIVAMSLRIAGVGSQVGMSEAQIMSFSAALSSVGIEAEAGGTAFSTLISKMNLATSKGGKDLEQFGKVAGMSGSQFKKAFEQDSAGAIMSFVKGLDKINKDGGSAIETLDEMGLSDIRMRDALLRAAGASDEFAEALGIGNEAWKENSALTNEAKQRYETLESRLKMFKNSLTDLGISMYDSMDNPMRHVVKRATKMVDSLQKAFDKDGFEGLSEQIGTVMAEAATKIAEASPRLVKAAAKTVKSFASGIIKNRRQIVTAAGQMAKAFAEGIADLLPKDLSNAVKNVINVFAGVAKPLLNIAEMALKAGSALSGLIPIVVGVIGAFKLNSVLNNFANALKLIQVGQKADTASKAANTIATNLNTIATKASSVAKVYSAAVEKSLAASMGTSTAALGTNTIAQRASAAASGVAAVASKGFSAVLGAMGGPVGIAVTAVGFLVGALATFTSTSGKAKGAMSSEAKEAAKLAKATRETAKAYEESKQSRTESYESSEAEAGTIEYLGKQVEDLSKKTHRTASEKSKLKLLVDELNERVPELGLAYDRESDKLNKNTNEIKKSIKAAKEKVIVDAARKLMAESAEGMIKAESKTAELVDAQSKSQEELNTKKKKYQSIVSEIGGKQSKAAQQAKEEMEAAKEVNNANTEALKQNKQEIAGYQKELDGYSKKASDLLTKQDVTANLDKLAQDAKIKAREIPKHLKDGILEGSYANPVDAQELKALMKFDSIITDSEPTLKAQGIKIPNAIANGAKEGGQALVSATSSLQSLVNFSNLVTKAKKAGTDTPKSVIAGINTGKYAIPKKMSELSNLIKFDNAVKKAGLAGKKIPEYIAKGISSGKPNYKKALIALEDYTNFKKSLAVARKAGADIPKGLAKKVASGDITVAKAMEIVNDAASKEANKLPSKTKDSGGKSVDGMKKSALSKKGEAVGAFRSVASESLDAANSKTPQFGSVGRGMVSGIQAGANENSGSLFSTLRSIASSALAAAKAVLGIKSPSVEFREQVGKMIVEGAIAGLKARQSKLYSSVKTIMGNTVKAAKDANGNYSEIGSNFLDSYTTKIQTRQELEINAYTNSVNRKIDALKRADEKEENALQAKQDKQKRLREKEDNKKIRALEKSISNSSKKQKEAYKKELSHLKANIKKREEKISKANKKKRDALKKDHKEEQSAASLAGKKMISAYSNALKKQSKTLIAQAEKNIRDISDKYQKQYDEIVQKQGEMKSKLMDVGDLVVTKTGNISGYGDLAAGNLEKQLDRNLKTLTAYGENLNNLKNRIPESLLEEILKMGVTDANAYMKKLLKMEDEKFDEYVKKWETEQATVKKIEDQYLNSTTLGNINNDIEKMKKYQEGIGALKGEIPQSMMEKILGMGIDEANTYMGQLLQLSNEDFKKYVELWKQKESLANSISKNFFSSDLNKLKEDYSAAIDKSMKGLETQMKNVGKNVAAAFVKGLKSQTSGMSKVIKDICKEAIEQAKKALKIKSPSRVFMEIGKNTIRGAQVGAEKEAKNLYKATDQVAKNFADRFAAAQLDVTALYDKMQASVIAETSKAPASVQVQMIQQQSVQRDTDERPQQPIEVHVHTELDGREVAKTISRFTDRELGILRKRRERGG